MGLTPLIWKPASPEEEARTGDERWPLLDELLGPAQFAAPDPDPHSRVEALRNLIRAAFGR